MMYMRKNGFYSSLIELCMYEVFKWVYTEVKIPETIQKWLNIDKQTAMPGYLKLGVNIINQR